MLKILQSQEQIDSARKYLLEKNISFVESNFKKMMRKLRLSQHLPVGDIVKSWDVMETIHAIEQRYQKKSHILDIGSYCSEVPVALGYLDYSNVHAIDLNPGVKNMPFNDRVNYSVGNFLATPYPNEMFDVVTSISVIEHGYEPQKLFSEMSRLLKPGGEFIASFDYWPEKIDTRQTKFFDMSWLIFSAQDVEEMLNIAARHGLEPTGSIENKAKDRPIHCMGFDYTFAWLSLRKKI